MKISLSGLSVLFAILLSVETFAAPVPNIDARDEFVCLIMMHNVCSLRTYNRLQGLEVRKFKLKAPKAKAKKPIKIAKPKPVRLTLWFHASFPVLIQYLPQKKVKAVKAKKPTPVKAKPVRSTVQYICFISCLTHANSRLLRRRLPRRRPL
jgi:hypothetical protein